MQLLLTASSSQQELSPPLFDNIFDTYDGGGSEICSHKITKSKSYFVLKLVAVSFFAKCHGKVLFHEVSDSHFPYPKNRNFIN
jgi:hypothetical protein